VEQQPTLIQIRAAAPEDIPELQKLIEASVRGLMPQGYTKDQLDGALGTLLGVDTQLIADGTYFVAEVALGSGKPMLVGCGGWSKRKTLFGSDHRPGREDELLDPRNDAAKIRAFFVHPEWARRGIGSRILEVCERAAEGAGFRRFEMGATLTGVPMYRARGYVETERIEVPLANDASLSVIHMSKAARQT
jgi:N-acetylglutamate synthase-like GNAT family acetyltransferase